MRNLLIVVLVSLFVANAGFAESDEPMVKAKLDRVMQTMEPVKVALSMYYQEQGAFPGKAETVTHVNAGKPTPASSIWNALGFAVYPALPPEVFSLAYVPFKVQGHGAGSFGIILTLQNIKANTIDGQLIGFSPSDDMAITGPAGATSVVGDIRGLSAIMFHYSCHQMTSQPVDPLVRQYFDEHRAPYVCK